MATIIRLKGVKFNNPNLPIVDVTKHPAQLGLLAEWDMQTIIGTSLQDLSGNNNHAVMGSTPNHSVISQGIQYPTNANTDSVAVTSLTAKQKNTTVFSLVRRDTALSDGFMLGAWDYGGHGLWWTGSDPDKLANAIKGVPNDGFVGKSLSIGQWALLVLTLNEDGTATFKELLSGHSESETIGSFVGAEYAIGGNYFGPNGSEVRQFQSTGVTLGYCGVYDKALSDEAEGYLLDYIKDKMLQRGVAL
ncbi:hypothetical protein P3488_10370 [Vibrio parahaemolyticus]|nr:hypothetical protein [Vibrio parahaemolyticus]